MKRLKILVFEYITGGGLNGSDLPDALAREGLLMLQALLDNLAQIDAVEAVVMLDYRMAGRLIAQPINTHIIKPEHDCRQEFACFLKSCDAVWPVAPETDGLLRELCEQAGRTGRRLLTSPASAVAIAADKWATYQLLQRHGIPTVETQRLVDFDFTANTAVATVPKEWVPTEWIVKPVDGVGCEDSYLIFDRQDFVAITAGLDAQKYIIQPHLKGKKISLSCLFKQGRGWLLCVNQQHFSIRDKQYQLDAISVNFTADTAKYFVLVNAVATAMPELWGYVGIDLIETADEILVLEINPRLTTSFAGIHEATGINCAKAAIDLLDGEPQLIPTRNHVITIRITNKDCHVH